jgi:hypothetical protein
MPINLYIKSHLYTKVKVSWEKIICWPNKPGTTIHHI